MATLTGQAPGASYGGLLTCSSAGNTGLTNVLQNIQDGVGNVSVLQLSRIAANFTGTFQIGGITLSMAQGALQFPPLAANPAGPVNGMIYVNSADNTLRYYAGGAWRTVTGV